jgi:hypothetical protein
MLRSIAIGYSDAIAQRYSETGQASEMSTGETTKGFWDRLTSRMAEKWPDRYPLAGKISQKAAGQLIGKSQNTGWKWQHGTLPERKHMAELALKLGVAVEWLETGRGPQFVPDPQDPVSLEIYRLVADSDELQRMEALNFLQYLAGKDVKQAGRR